MSSDMRFSRLFQQPHEANSLLVTVHTSLPPGKRKQLNAFNYWVNIAASNPFRIPLRYFIEWIMQITWIQHPLHWTSDHPQHKTTLSAVMQRRPAISSWHQLHISTTTGKATVPPNTSAQKNHGHPRLVIQGTVIIHGELKIWLTTHVIYEVSILRNHPRKFFSYPVIIRDWHK